MERLQNGPWPRASHPERFAHCYNRHLSARLKHYLFSLYEDVGFN